MASTAQARISHGVPARCVLPASAGALPSRPAATNWRTRVAGKRSARAAAFGVTDSENAGDLEDTRRGIYDNMRTTVDKGQRGKQRTVNGRFAATCSHYLFDPDFHNGASGWEKGVVEKNVQDSRRRIWIEAATRRFGSFIELNAWRSERCRSV